MRALPSVLCAALGLLSACAAPRFSDRVTARLDAALRDTQARLAVPGLMAGLWVRGVGSWQAAAGVADPATAEPMRPEQRLRIGSITKTFTVTLLLRLVDRGLVRLDDPVGRYVTGVPGGDRITLRQLGDMTAGLGSYTFDAGFQRALFADPSRPWTPAELLDIGFRVTRQGCPGQATACFPPGTSWFYSNTNTVLLAMALERAAGRPYRDLLREEVLDPLGLASTFQPTSGELPAPRVRGFTSQGTAAGQMPQEATGWNPSWAFGVGDLVSTFDDLRRWGEALGTGALLSPASRAERFRRGTLPPNSDTRAYALGIGYNRGWWGHGGEIPGYNALAYYRPDVDAVLVVVASRDVIEADGAEVHPAYVLADKLIEIAAEEAPLGDFDPEARYRE